MHAGLGALLFGRQSLFLLSADGSAVDWFHLLYPASTRYARMFCYHARTQDPWAPLLGADRDLSCASKMGRGYLLLVCFCTMSWVKVSYRDAERSWWLEKCVASIVDHNSLPCLGFRVGMPKEDYPQCICCGMIWFLLQNVCAQT